MYRSIDVGMSAAELMGILYDKSDPRNIYYKAEGEWDPFVENILLCIRNRSSASLPLAKLNAHDSISFFLEKGKHGSFEENFNAPYIVEQLDFHRKKFGWPLIEDRKQVIEKHDEKSDVTGIVEYQVNLSPEQLDAILKLQPKYSYRGEDSILKLRNQITLKPGVICLFPVAPLGDQLNAMRVAGCQTIEIPTIQLLHLLPDFDGIERHFHWMVPQVEEKLSINVAVIEYAINTVLEDRNMLLEGARFYAQALAGDHIICDPASSERDIRIVEMSPEARHIYLTYGNIGVDEIDALKSVEISTTAFLNTIKEVNQLRYDNGKEDGLPAKELKEILDSLLIIDEMISREAVGMTLAHAVAETSETTTETEEDIAPHADAETVDNISSALKGQQAIREVLKRVREDDEDEKTNLTPKR
jgi:hypothetical protein